jgi:hypothetical protein
MRAYCWPTGHAFEMLPNGDCPECGSFGKDHRPASDEVCWSFADCTPDWSGRSSHGHPCELPIGHSGPHVCQNARTACEAKP